MYINYLFTWRVTTNLFNCWKDFSNFLLKTKYLVRNLHIVMSTNFISCVEESLNLLVSDKITCRVCRYIIIYHVSLTNCLEGWQCGFLMSEKSLVTSFAVIRNLTSFQVLFSSSFCPALFPSVLCMSKVWMFYGKTSVNVEFHHFASFFHSTLFLV